MTLDIDLVKKALKLITDILIEHEIPVREGCEAMKTLIEVAKEDGLV